MSIFGDVVHWAGRTVSNVTAPVRAVGHVVSKGIHAVEHATSHIPLVGPALHATIAVTGLGLAANLASGARVDRAVLSDFRDKLAATREVAPYVTTIVSFVPGVGTGVAAAIAAASALAEGKRIDDALIEGVKNALPGGAAARLAFDTAANLYKGKSLSKAALDAARSQLPAEARAAFDIGVAVYTGRKLQDALVDAAKNLTPAAAGALVGAGVKLASTSPVLSKVRELVPDIERKGFDLGLGVMTHSGVSEATVHAIRGKLTAAQRLGFDKALEARVAHLKRAALAVAAPHEVLTAAGSKDPKKKEAARVFLRQTVKGAKLGDPLALQSLRALRAASRNRRARGGVLVKPGGLVVIPSAGKAFIPA